MRRILKFMLHAALIVVAAMASFIIVDGRTQPGGGNVGTLFNGVVAAAAGMLFGLMLAWFRRIPWRALPQKLQAWRTEARRQFWWMTAGCVSTAVLILY